MITRLKKLGLGEVSKDLEKGLSFLDANIHFDTSKYPLLQLQAKLNKLQKDRYAGVIEEGIYSIEHSKLVSSAIEFISKLKIDNCVVNYQDAFIRVISPQTSYVDVPLFQLDEILIGRSKDADILIIDPLVSRNHCIIQVNQRKYFLKDLDSANGTYLDGVKIQGGIRLESANIISVCGYKFQIVDPGRTHFEGP